jgi:hypothetical protein
MSLQIKNILTPFVALLVAWLSRQVPFIDAATWGSLIDGALTFIVAGVLGYFNRSTAVISDAANNSEVKQVILEPSASKATMDATPPNVTK